ncbi:MAG TPA: shikimate kinase [Candidatus Sulfotelmatobacter sp.]|nr:shikimate kinase [Candidatus Sulfotelmatobacter sp.]
MTIRMHRTPSPVSVFVPAKTLVLVGLMGAGKSSVGRRLAARLGLPFVDADQEIEAAAGMTIEEIFARHGEPAFRDGERRVIARLLDNPTQVLATGGGAFMDERTRALVRERAVSIWLHAELDELLRRVSRRTDRPLLKGADPRAVLERLIAERYPIYAQADVTVPSSTGSADETVDRILERLGALPQGSAP